MPFRASWGEGPWWRGARRDYLVPIVLAVVLVFALHTLALRQQASPPLQRFYIDAYRTSCTVVRRPLLLPYVVEPNGSRRLAAIGDVVVLPPSQAGALRLRLSDGAVRAGTKGIEFARMSGAGLLNACAALERQIQANRAAVRTEIPVQVWAPIGVGLIAFMASVTRWRRRARSMRRGQTLRGPELVTPAVFNRLNRSDGIGFRTADGGSAWTVLGGRSGTVSIPRRQESSHLLLMGDTGTGKSSLIRQILEQVSTRDEAAIVYDPALEFTPQFYRPERGDHILNPLDTRMPYWSPGDEVQHRAEALAFAKALFPDDRRDNRFFVESPRKIFARLLSFKPTAQEIARWLQHPAEIDRLLGGTELASMIDPAAASQRAGVLASLSMVGDSFQLIPARDDCNGQWSAYEWAQHRKGWLFLTSTPQTLDRLRPLISVWLDLLIMRLLGGGAPVWIFLDELPTLNKLPKLPEALALARKPNVRLVLGFQGRAQLEARYQTESEAMLSQPATKVFLRTSEPRAAEWISKALGEIEVERLKESVNYGKSLQLFYHRKGHGYSLDRQTKPLVLASEIIGLRNLTAYLKSENHVVKFRFEPNPVQERQPALLPRATKAADWPQRPAVGEPATAPPTQPSASSAAAGHRLRVQSRQQAPQRPRPSIAAERDPYFE